MRSIKLKKIAAHYYFPEDCQTAYQGDIGRLLLFLTSNLSFANYTDWIEFLDNTAQETVQTDSVNVAKNDEYNLIRIFDCTGLHPLCENCKDPDPFITSQENFKHMILDWIELLDQQVEGIEIIRYNRQIEFNEYIPASHHLLNNIDIIEKTTHQDITLILQRIFWKGPESFDSSEHISPFGIWKKPGPSEILGYISFDSHSLHSLNNLMNFLADEINNENVNFWLKWLY